MVLQISVTKFDSDNGKQILQLVCLPRQKFFDKTNNHCRYHFSRPHRNTGTRAMVASMKTADFRPAFSSGFQLAIWRIQDLLVELEGVEGRRRWRFMKVIFRIWVLRLTHRERNMFPNRFPVLRTINDQVWKKKLKKKYTKLSIDWYYLHVISINVILRSTCGISFRTNPT